MKSYFKLAVAALLFSGYIAFPAEGQHPKEKQIPKERQFPKEKQIPKERQYPKERQITRSPKTHALDNNDNFSPDGRFLCYDTRGTVYSEELSNCKSIEKVEIATGKETVLWDPPSVSGEQAAPGVAAVSWHPFKNKVIFIHGPTLGEVAQHGYYSIRNRTAYEVDGDGRRSYQKVDMRDVENTVTTPGAHRGGTHRHEYSRDGSRIGFTYDDYLLPAYGRTIGFMQPNADTPEGYTHYFALILKPVLPGKSKAGEIERAFGDSWINAEGTMRGFIGKVRAANGVDYHHDLFVAEIPKDLDITTADPGSRERYPEPPEGISVRRLTHGMEVTGIVRGSGDGSMIAFTARNGNEPDQLYIIKADGSEALPHCLTHHDAPVFAQRWHPSEARIFYISGGHIFTTRAGDALTVGNGTQSGSSGALSGSSAPAGIGTQASHGGLAGDGPTTGNTVRLTEQARDREQLVVSPDGNRLAYTIRVPTCDRTGHLRKDATGNDFRQIFIMDIDREKLH